jgi:hypothetical protein
MRYLLILLTSVAIASPEPDLSDIDVQAIAKLSEQWLHGPPTSISAASAACTLTAEEGCTLEVHVVADGPQYLTVSKIGGTWQVGRWQRELIAYQRCIRALMVNQAQENAQGLPIDPQQRRKEDAACSGPSGHVGGMRGQ